MWVSGGTLAGHFGLIVPVIVNPPSEVASEIIDRTIFREYKQEQEAGSFGVRGEGRDPIGTWRTTTSLLRVNRR